MELKDKLVEETERCAEELRASERAAMRRVSKFVDIYTKIFIGAIYALIALQIPQAYEDWKRVPENLKTIFSQQPVESPYSSRQEDPEQWEDHIIKYHINQQRAREQGLYRN